MYSSPPKRSLSFRPSLEALEDRCLPSVTFGGGPIIPHVQVNTLLFGQEWTSGSGLQVRNALNLYLQTLVNSPYMDMLSQYGVGRGSFGSTWRIWYTNDTTMSEQLDDSGGQNALKGLLIDAIQEGHLPTPNANQLYVIFLPPGEELIEPGGEEPTWETGTLGYHSWFTSPDYGTIYYAVIPFPDGNPNPITHDLQSSFNSLTTTVSHEVAEAVTDPMLDTNYGWDDQQFGNGGEIGDLVEHKPPIYWNGYVVQQEANQQEQGMSPNLPSASVSVAATSNRTFNGTVMNFLDHSTNQFGDTPIHALGGSPLADSSFQVTIDWGDGQTSSGQVVYNGDGQYSVVGSHSYVQTGSYQIQVWATDVYGMTAYAASSANVVPPPQPTLKDDFNLLIEGFEYELDHILAIFLPAYRAAADQMWATAQSNPAWNTQWGNLFWQLGMMYAEQALTGNHNS